MVGPRERKPKVWPCPALGFVVLVESELGVDFGGTDDYCKLCKTVEKRETHYEFICLCLLRAACARRGLRALHR